METELTQGLTFLAWTSGAFLIITGIFVVILLFNLSKLACNMNKSAEIIKNELEPIMKNISESTATINKMVQKTDEKVGKITAIYEKISGAVTKSVSKASVLSGFLLKSAFKGLFSVFKSMLKMK